MSVLCRVGLCRVETRHVTFSFWPLEHGDFVDYCTRGDHIYFSLATRIRYWWDRR